MRLIGMQARAANASTGAPGRAGEAARRGKGSLPCCTSLVPFMCLDSSLGVRGGEAGIIKLVSTYYVPRTTLGSFSCVI